MRLSTMLTTLTVTVASAMPALAYSGGCDSDYCKVPEIGTAGSLAAVTAVAAVVAVIRQRRNRS